MTIKIIGTRKEISMVFCPFKQYDYCPHEIMKCEKCIAKFYGVEVECIGN